MKRELLTIYSWLIQFSGSHLSYETQSLKELAFSALDNGDKDFVKQVIVQMKARANTEAQGWEKSELKVISASLAHYLGDHATSLLLLREALNEFSTQAHFLAVTHWMFSYIYWQLPERALDASFHGTRSVAIFNQLAFTLDDKIDIAWYQEKLAYINQVLYFSRMKRQYILTPLPPMVEYRQTSLLVTASPPAEQPEKQPDTVPSKSPKPRRSLPQPPPPLHQYTRQTILDKNIPIISYIPAGGLEAIKREEVGLIKPGPLIIAGRRYFAHNLREPGNVKLLENRAYFAALVRGDSMNVLKIEHGDFVIIQLQETADNMEIVLAQGPTEIDEIGKATLKVLYRQGDHIELRPQSTNPVHEPIVLTANDHLKIIGIAIAVLKPIEDE